MGSEITFRKKHVEIPAKTLASAKNKAKKLGFVQVSTGNLITSKGTVKGLKIYHFKHK